MGTTHTQSGWEITKEMCAEFKSAAGRFVFSTTLTGSSAFKGKIQMWPVDRDATFPHCLVELEVALDYVHAKFYCVCVCVCLLRLPQLNKTQLK